MKVAVHVRDRNDNSPEFTKERYEVEVQENIEQVRIWGRKMYGRRGK